MSEEPDGLRERVTRQSEEALGRAAQELFSNPMVTGAIAQVFGAREKAVQAQTAAMGALNLPSAADIERLTRRMRSLSQRLEGIEEGVDRLGSRVAPAAATTDGDRLDALQQQIAALTAEVTALRESATAPAGSATPTPPPPRRAAAKKPAPKAKTATATAKPTPSKAASVAPTSTKRTAS